MSIKMNFDPDDLFDPKKHVEQAMANRIKKKFPGIDFTVELNLETNKFNITGLTEDQVTEALQD